MPNAKDDQNLTPTTEVYAYIEKFLGLTRRTVLWYATEGLIPKPIRKGVDSFYDLAESQLIPRLRVITLLQRDFEFRLWKIKDILAKYQGQSIHKLSVLLRSLNSTYPIDPTSADEPIGDLEHNKAVREVFLKKLEEGVPAEELSLVEAEREVDRLSS